MKLIGEVLMGGRRRSLPTRERELKLRDLLRGFGGGRSLPTRERELKLFALTLGLGELASLPTRERELKHTAGSGL